MTQEESRTHGEGTALNATIDSAQYTASRPYAAAAEMYHRAGWPNPIPVQGKSRPVTGYTGHGGKNVSPPDRVTWEQGPEGAHNIALRMAGTIGIDVDAHDGEVGNITLKNAMEALGDLPPTWSTTARGQGQASRIYLFHIPFSREHLVRPEAETIRTYGANIEIIRKAHRYAMVWPSVHPETGETYQWYAPDGSLSDRIPRKDELPDLPEAWLDFLAPEHLADEDRCSTPVFSAGGSMLFGGGARVVNANDRPYTPAQAEEFLKAELSKLRAVKIGQGVNQALFSFARSMAHFQAFYTQEQCQGVVAEAFRQDHGWPALDRDDLGTIASAYKTQEQNRAANDLDQGWVAYEIAEPEAVDPARVRKVDLRPFLDGTWKAPVPSVGGARQDGSVLLYPGKWHTLIAKTGSGKSWFALWHCVAELRKGNTVVYAHFEESSPGGTLDRLRTMAPDLSVNDITDRFIWLDCSTAWKPGEFASEMPDEASLVILDGINAAAGQHGTDPTTTDAVAVYRRLLVTPAMATGAAVLSLGHPPKARDRQRERHGFGSTAWLDEMDGVGFRLVSSRKPIRRSNDGYSMLYSVKDRYGQVEEIGELETGDDMEGWYVLGSFHVDSSGEAMSVRLNKPQTNEEGGKRDAVDDLADKVMETMWKLPGMAFATQRDLTDKLKADGVAFTASNIAPALLRLVDRGKLDWPETGPRKARPGRLTPGACFESAEIQNSSLLR